MIISCFDRVTTRVHQMRFAESHTPIEVQWIVSTTWRLSHSHRSCVCKLIARAYNETIVGITRTETRLIVADVVDDRVTLTFANSACNRGAGRAVREVGWGVRYRRTLDDLRLTDFPAQRITIQPQIVQRLVQELGIIADDPVLDHFVWSSEMNDLAGTIQTFKLNRAKPSFQSLLI